MFLARFTWLFAALLLCQCATKHQPIPFSAYFPTRPERDLSRQQLDERESLEKASDLGELQKKRLQDLRHLELRSLKPGTPRYEALAATIAEVKPELAHLKQEVEEVRADAAKLQDSPTATPNPARAPIETPELKAPFQEAYRLWNQDDNEAALAKISETLSDEKIRSRASSDEWYRALNLKFRVLLDLSNVAEAEKIYVEMKDLEDCAPDTVQGGFLVALHKFALGDGAGARRIFIEQCDPDESPSNAIKRRYWLARFSEADPSGQSAALYEQISSSRLPGYYVYLTRARLGKRVEIPRGGSEGARPYLSTIFDVSRHVHYLLSSAEMRLRANLRRDASAFLVKASRLLRRDVSESNVLPLLYTAHLLQAASNHLEAMRIYSVITTAFQEDSPAVATLTTGFLAEMFPRPFGPSVEWLCRQWNNDPDFVYAIMRQESAFNPGAVSPADARGLMQLMPFLAKDLATRWGYRGYYHDRILFYAEENLKLATFHLYQLRQVAPHYALIAASYNAGMQRVSGWWKRFGHLPLDVFIELIPVAETRDYVKLVLRNYLYYKALRSDGAMDPGFIPLQLPLYRAPDAISVSSLRVSGR